MPAALAIAARALALLLSLAASGLGLRAVRALGLSLLCLALAGCATKRQPEQAPPSITNPAPAIAEGAAKDAAITTEANAIAARSNDAPFVAASAARILDVLRISPWAKTEATINTLVTERDTALAAGKADARVIADLRAQLDKANSRTDQIIRLGLAAAGAVCIGLGVLSAFLAAKVAAMFPGLGPRLSIGIGALGGCFLFCSFAYGWAMRNQTLVMIVFACLCVAVATLFYANRHNAKA